MHPLTRWIAMRRLLLLASLALAPVLAKAAEAQTAFTRADTLRGSNTPERAWWDAEFYDLHVRVSPADSSIRGLNGITYRVVAPAREMQIDLQRPLAIDSVIQDGKRLAFRREGDAYFLTPTAPHPVGARKVVRIYYHGAYGAAATAAAGLRRPGGPFIWSTDSTGAPWFATSNEGPGASTWWPLKDLPASEPDSQRIAITVPSPLINISNGRLRSTKKNRDGTTTYEWFVSNPINSYNVAINTSGSYVQLKDEFRGEKGPLSVEFWPLAANRAKAQALLPQVKSMLACFERWFGTYPWYEDGYKLIEVPYLGMEHQSGIAYGNRYLPGYLGRDLSGTGEGLGWDYILVHESAHEWWGNNISAKDHTDMWIHESFGMYAEALFLECQQDRAAGERYVAGLRRNIKNDIPIIGSYGVNHVPRSQDRYYKGANMLMTLRAVVDDDTRWHQTLRGLNETFRHQTVTADQVRDYMSATSGIDLRLILKQYLETTMVPTLEYQLGDSTLWYRWSNVVPGFAMPVRVALSGASGEYTRLQPTERWQSVPASLGAGAELMVDPAFYVTATRMTPKPVTTSAKRGSNLGPDTGHDLGDIPDGPARRRQLPLLAGG
jgi:aminopeptidase N